MESNKAKPYQLKVNVPNIIQLLTESLYPQKEVAIREIVQNASDALTRRLVEDKAFSKETACIVIEITPSTNRLSITDTGIGMDSDDLQNILTSVGRSGTHEFRKMLSSSDVPAVIGLIGQFGLGFLSAFLIADRVTIISRKYGTNSKTSYFSSGSENTYEIAEISDDHPIGTTVILDLKSDARDMLDVSTIEALIVRYSNFLSYPIYIAGKSTPINATGAPWHHNGTDDEYWSFVRTYYEEDALMVFPIKSATASGVLFIPRIGPRAYPKGNIHLYIQRMFIHESDQYLPASLGFLKGCLESSELLLTASRSNVIENDSYIRFREEVADFAYQKLREFVQTDDETARTFLAQYDRLLKAEALQDNVLLENFYRYILLPSSTGRSLQVNEYLQSASSKYLEEEPCIYYFSEISKERRRVITDALAFIDLPVVDASLPIDRLFLDKLQQLPQNIKCYQVSYEAVRLLVRSSSQGHTRTELESLNITGNIRRKLNLHFSDAELREICFDLNIDYETLPGEDKRVKIMEMITYLERRDRLSELVIICKQLRPGIVW